MEESLALSTPSESLVENETEGEVIDIKQAALLRLRNKIKKLKVQAQEVGELDELKDAWKTATAEYEVGDLDGATERSNNDK